MTYNPKGFNIPENLEKAEGMFALDFHQVAVYSPSPIDAAALLGGIGFSQWFTDTATLTGLYAGLKCRIHAEMYFNYQILPGKEFEFVRYADHPHPGYSGDHTFLSHISAYVDNIEEAVEEAFWKYNMLPVHRFTTSNHTNPRVAGKKHFREAIFETPEFGFNMKLIEKVIEQ